LCVENIKFYVLFVKFILHFLRSTLFIHYEKISWFTFAQSAWLACI